MKWRSPTAIPRRSSCRRTFLWTPSSIPIKPLCSTRWRSVTMRRASCWTPTPHSCARAASWSCSRWLVTSQLSPNHGAQ
eukprot:8571061-Lingulodinium_polyedra.AAC.1